MRTWNSYDSSGGEPAGDIDGLLSIVWFSRVTLGTDEERVRTPFSCFSRSARPRRILQCTYAAEKSFHVVCRIWVSVSQNPSVSGGLKQPFGVHTVLNHLPAASTT